MTDKKQHELKLYSWVINPKNDQVNFIRSVCPLNGIGVEYPKDGVNLLYGKRFARESFAEASRSFKDQGDIFVPVEIRMTAVRPVHAKHWFDRPDGKNVFDLHRLSPDQETLIAEYWRRYLEADGVDGAGVNWDRRDFVGQFPSFLDRIRKERLFQDIDVLIWRTREKGKVISRATLYNPHRILSMRAIGAEHLQVALPKIQANAA